MGFSTLVILYTSVSRVIMFLMWIIVLLFSSVQQACPDLNSAPYILYGELFFGFDL